MSEIKYIVFIKETLQSLECSTPEGAEHYLNAVRLCGYTPVLIDLTGKREAA